MKRFIILIVSMILCADSYSGIRLQRSVSIVDDVGIVKYMDLEVHEIVGAIDGVEIIGYRGDGMRESRGYVYSAAPRWVSVVTNNVFRPYVVKPRREWQLKRSGVVNISTIMLSETNSMMVVAKSVANKMDEACIYGEAVADWYSQIMVDKDTGYGFALSGRIKFEGGSNDSLAASLYKGEGGNVKVWYEVVDPGNKVRNKGWISGSVDKNGGAVEVKKKHVLLGSDDINCSLSAIKISAKDGKMWLSFTVCKGADEAHLGCPYSW